MRSSAVVIAACLAAGAGAQDLTTLPTATSSTSATGSGSPVGTSIVSLFLPMGSPDQIDASIISASPNHTAFALGCGNNASITDCGWDPPITVTEGESTIIWTNTQNEDLSATAPIMTLECALVGAHTTESPINGASSAVCTARSTIENFGIVASTTVLASTEISYMPVTITAGMEKIAAASEYAATAVHESETSSAGAPAVTAMAVLGLTGMAGLGVAVLGLL
ncbi:hypothetical protein CERZMDRAFT_99403 [Cercospora zeae-maydis SCOH1-5]|uniref:Ig-like domain-containing protein n=1 Tax=Cercospora zeae-maydis SCOH1-5 TaxID=717836 RepID=A0A6A6FAB2_9PEZI|nr:hypothetical protein CERZMDRAFT_99403 [Cercospora zeae-maydis SCOH1-5]